MIKKYCFFFLCFYSPCLFAGSAQIEWQHFTSKPSLKEQLSDYLLFKGNYPLSWIKEPFSIQSRFLMEYSLDRSDFFYFNTSELFFSYKYDLKNSFYSINSIKIELGRKIKQWSKGDEYWKLGLWNPLIYWNSLHPETSGLIGSFINFQSKQWSADFFIGALYLPHSQPKLIIEDNKSSYTHSRWVTSLPLKVNPYNLNIYYSTLKPFLFDFLFQQSFAASFKTWSKTANSFYWLKWSIADKPSNRLYHVLNKAKRFKIDSQKNDPAFVDQTISILPVRQRILSTEWGLDYKKVSTNFTLEYTEAKEDNLNKSKDWFFIHSREDFTYFSFLLKYKYKEKSQFELGWIQSLFKNFNIYEQEEKEPPGILSQTHILNGWGIGWSAVFKNHKGLPCSFNIKYQHSFLNKGDWLSGKLLYYITPRFYSQWTVDILGVKNEENSSFLKSFKHNDYWTWSLAYDF